MKPTPASAVADDAKIDDGFADVGMRGEMCDRMRLMVGEHRIEPRTVKDVAPFERAPI